MKQFCHLVIILAAVFTVAGRARGENLGNSILVCKLQKIVDSNELMSDDNYEDNQPDSAFDRDLRVIDEMKNIPVEYPEDYYYEYYDTRNEKKIGRGRSTSLELSTSSSSESETKSSDSEEEKKRRKKKHKHKKKKKKDKDNRAHVIYWYTTTVRNPGFNFWPQYQDWSTKNPLDQTDIHGWSSNTNGWGQSSVSYHKPFPTSKHSRGHSRSQSPTRWGKGTTDGGWLLYNPYQTTRGYGAANPKDSFYLK